jgi:hypothetical protein
MKYCSTVFTMNPSMPNASTKNRMNVPNRPAFDSLARFQMTNSMKMMKPASPKVRPNWETCSSLKSIAS